MTLNFLRCGLNLLKSKEKGFLKTLAIYYKPWVVLKIFLNYDKFKPRNSYKKKQCKPYRCRSKDSDFYKVIYIVNIVGTVKLRPLTKLDQAK